MESRCHIQKGDHKFSTLTLGVSSDADQLKFTCIINLVYNKFYLKSCLQILKNVYKCLQCLHMFINLVVEGCMENTNIHGVCITMKVLPREVDAYENVGKLVWGFGLR